MLGILLSAFSLPASAHQDNSDSLFAYYISPNKLSWVNANAYCQEFCGSELASIHSIEQHRFISSQTTLSIDIAYGSNNIWIGLSVRSAFNSTLIYNWADQTPFDYHRFSAETNLTRTIANASSCVSLDIDSFDYEWIGEACTQRNRFVCNSCNSRVNKYVMIDEKLNYSNAETFCQQHVFNSSLASIHSVADVQHTKSLVGYDASWHTFIGLNDLNSDGEFRASANQSSTRNLTWTDGTSFDFGTAFGVFPWRQEEPNNAAGGAEQCIAMYQQQRWWNDISCINDERHTFICNMPSEICHAPNWFVPQSSSWRMHACNAESYGDGEHEESVMLLNERQFVNSNEMLVMEYTFGIMENATNRTGETGLRLYHSAHDCSEYHSVSVSNEWRIALLKHVNNATQTLTFVDLPRNASAFGSFYRLKVTLENGTYFSVQWNEQSVVDRFEDRYHVQANVNGTDPLYSNQFKNKSAYSGFIALFNQHLHVHAKALYVSGSPVAVNSPLFCGAVQSATVSPSISSSNSRYGIDIVIHIKADSNTNLTEVQISLTHQIQSVVNNSIASAHANCSAYNLSSDFRSLSNSASANSQKISIKFTIFACNENLRNQIQFNLNISLQTNLRSRRYNETVYILQYYLVALNPETVSVTKASWSTPAPIDYLAINTVHIPYPASSESTQSVIWDMALLIIGAVIMCLLCVALFLCFFAFSSKRLMLKSRRSTAVQSGSHESNSQKHVASHSHSRLTQPSHVKISSTQSLQIPSSYISQFSGSDHESYYDSDMKLEEELKTAHVSHSVSPYNHSQHSNINYSPHPPVRQHPFAYPKRKAPGRVDPASLQRAKSTPSRLQRAPNMIGYHSQMSDQAVSEEDLSRFIQKRHSRNRTVGNSVYINHVLLAQPSEAVKEQKIEIMEEALDDSEEVAKSDLEAVSPDGYHHSGEMGKMVQALAEYQQIEATCSLADDDDDETDSLWQAASPRQNQQGEGVKETTTPQPECQQHP